MARELGIQPAATAGCTASTRDGRCAASRRRERSGLTTYSPASATSTPASDDTDASMARIAPRYSRGLRTTLLLEAGRRLLRERTLEQVSIQEICAQAGVTTGAFYSRFEGKDSYFRALQALVLATLRKGMAEPLAQLHPAGASPELELRIRFAHQALAGTLLYALINRDSTFALSDRRLDMEMARAFLLYVA